MKRRLIGACCLIVAMMVTTARGDTTKKQEADQASNEVAEQDQQPVEAAPRQPAKQDPDGAKRQAAGRKTRLTAAQKRAQAKAALLARYDADGDGKLDAKERKAIHADRAKQKRQRSKSRRDDAPGGLRGPQPAQQAQAADAAAAASRTGSRGDSQAKLLARFDRNRNGRLEGAELDAARQAIRRAKGGQGGSSSPPHSDAGPLDHNGDGQLDPAEAASRSPRAQNNDQ